MQKTPTLLSADDDIDDQDLIREAILTSGVPIQFQAVGNGRELLQFLHQRKILGDYFPKVILLDLNMPVLNGKDTLLALKKEAEEIRQIPVVMLSTSAAREDVAFCLQHGAMRFITKPSTFGELCIQIRSVINVFCENANTFNFR